MLEQRNDTTTNATNIPQTMTQLEGIRQKVFMDRYSLKDAKGNPLEFHPEQLWARVAKGIAATEQTAEKRAEWEKLFYEALTDFKFVPGGRILAGAGTGHQVTYYNCMPPDQEVLTANGYRPISDIAIGDLVVTHRNRLRPVVHKFERETEETLYIIRPKKVGYDDLRVTGDHKVYIVRSEWINKHKSRDGLRLQQEPAWIPAKEIKPGDFVAIVPSSPEHDIDTKHYFEYDNLKWVRIDEIAVEDYSGTVLDIEVEEDHSFISAGIVVSNCFVIPSPEDSRQGILDNLKVMTEIMARGGGVGINLSSLRPRGSYIKTVNGTASGPCSWAQLYSVATGDVIQQGGCFGPNERIATDKGLIPALELADRLDRGELIQAQTHKGFRPFTAVFRNGTNDLYEVTTSRGYRVQVTRDHKMGILRDGRVVTIPLRELEEGDELLLLLGEGHKNAAPLPLSITPSLRSKMRTTLNENVTLPTHLTAALAYVLGYLFQYPLADRERILTPTASPEGEYTHNILMSQVKMRYGDSNAIQEKKVTKQDTKGLSLTTADAYPEIRERLVTSLRSLFGLEPIVEKGDGAYANAFASARSDVKIDSPIVIEWLQENGLLKEESEHTRVPEAIFRASSEVVGAFIAGYFDADCSHHGKKGGYGIDSNSLEMLKDIQLLLIANGIVSHITVQDRKQLYHLTITGTQFKDRFDQFICGCKHQQCVGYRHHQNNYPITLWKPLLIPNRFYHSLTDPTKGHVSYQALTRIRERIAAAGGAAMVEQQKAVLGVLPDAIISITPLGPSDVYDFEVANVHLLAGGGIYTSNSRRGALMLMLDDTHPDIEEFITVKRTAGKIEHANLSACISDAFMQAVKDDAEWNLIWQGEVKKTIRARALWDLICTSAWESAEPGMVFMDRYNKESNTWYYENIRCVNPCVTGDTLIYTDRGLYPAKVLAEIGLPVNITSPNISVEELVPSRYAYQRNKTQITRADSSREVSVLPASHVFPTGIKQVYRLQTKEGYTLRLTGNHKILTLQGWKEASTLIEEDKIHLLHNAGMFGNIGNKELGEIYGWLVGDGYINTHGKGSACLCFWGSERSLADRFAQSTCKITGLDIIRERQEARIESQKLLSLLDHELLTDKLQVPPSVLRGSREMQQGFLSALFTADGCVLGEQKKGVSVRLTSVSQTLLENVQRVLLNFGIASRIYKNRRNASEKLLPNGKGGQALYNCRAYHDLVISCSNLALFAHEIGFLTKEKQDKLEIALDNYQRTLNQETYLATFESLLSDGIEQVYDLTEPEKHLFVANGLVVHNCGEQGLPPFGVCNLGALNLSYFVKNCEMDWEQLASISKIAIRFLDNVIDANEYFIEENRVAQLGTRRTGLGTMGLADALIKMQIPYGHEASLPVIERIYSTIRDASYEASTDIAVEKGAFPSFDRDKYMQGKFIQRLPQPIQDKIRQQGIRNAVLLTQAPTGTTSLLASVSSGIEPVYDFAMIRRDRTGEHILYHPLLQEWRDAHPNEATPDYFVSSKDLTPEEHVRVQAMIQRYTDSSISKTVNAPNHHTVADVQKLYRLAYEMGCKGVTYYRDGSRDAVLTRVEDEKKAAEATKQANASAATRSETETPQASIMEMVTSIHQGIKQRPAVVQGYTRQVKAPEGKINITINSDEQGPFEVFVNVGKAGSDIAALSEALGRLISLNLQLLSPLSQVDRAQEITNQLRGIGGSRSVGFGVQQVRSLPDAVARALELHLEALQSAATEAKSAHSNEGAHSKLTEKVSPPINHHNLSKLDVTGNLCCQCGCNTMVYEEGCRKCYSCGHSEC